MRVIFNNLLLFSILLLSNVNLLASFNDSLISKIENLTSIQEKINFLMNEGNSTYLSNSDYSYEVCDLAYLLAKEQNDSLTAAKANYCMARSILIKGDVERALNLLNECIDIFKRNELKIEYGDALSLKALTLRRIGELKQGTEVLKKAIDIFEKAGDDFRLMKCLINISLDYMDDKEYNYAYDHLARAEQINKKVNDTINQFYIALNLGSLYLETNNEAKALKYFNTSFEIAAQLNMTDALVTNLVMLGRAYMAIDRQDLAIQKFLVALDKANEFKLPHEKMEALEQLDIVFRQQKDYELALKYYEQYIQLRDSMYSVERLARIDHLEKQLDVEEKEYQLARNQLEIELQNTEIEKRKNQSYFFIGGLVLALVIIVFVFKNYKDKKKSAEIISKQKEEVELRKDEVEEKNKEILDSINYANKIQQALLKSEDKIIDALPPHFIFFRPKDIVSGDFYWAYEKRIDDKNYVYVAAADCTGHGVPGGFMSMLSIAFLNEIAGQDKYIEPAEILNQLRNKIIKELGQTGKIGESKDGLDISLCCLKKNNNKTIVEWAGANNPLWVISSQKSINSELHEVKPDKQPIGYFLDQKPFKNHTLDLSQGDSIFMFSDGFADQFGGEKGKKFKYKKFKSLLLSMNNEPLNRQKEILGETFDNWKGNLEQIDDVCVVGIKI